VLRRSYNVRSSQTGQASSSDLLAAFFAMPTSQCHDGIVAFDERISHPQPLMPWMCTPYTHTRRDDMLATWPSFVTKNGNLINSTQFKIQIFLCNCRNLRQVHLISPGKRLRAEF
jgi:hypothetical protein